MDVDSASSSPSSRLSVVCSASAEYSSNSSEGSSPNHSRRNSVTESVIKDEHYWERRRRNNDASRRSREKRRLNDLAMEEKILQLSAENERLKSQLENSAKPESSASRPPPSSSTAAPGIHVDVVAKNLFATTSVLQPANSILTVPLLQPSTHFPLLQLCHNLPSSTSQSVRQMNDLQLAADGPFRSALLKNEMIHSAAAPSTSSSTLFTSSTSAFHPFRASDNHPQQQKYPGVIMRTTEQQSPDSSTSNVIQRVGSPNGQQQPQQQPGPSLLSALLAQRRPSPTVPQSRTEHISGLQSPPRQTAGSKSDSESVSSSASLSPSHSSEDHSNSKSPQYVDRRRRNNEAAKRCRANRRAVFEYRSKRVQLLENENDELRTQIDSLKAEITHMKSILTHRAVSFTDNS